MQRAVESRLRATLEAYHPAPLHLFSSLDRDIALAFIRDYPNPVAASRMTVDRMARFCRRHHYSGRVDPAVLLARMQPHLLAGSPGTTAGKQIMALHLVDQLEMLNQQERDFNVHLAAAVAAHPDGALFTSFPGIASVIAGVMIGELGDDRARFPAPGALLAESGLAPVTRASGRTRQVRFRYAANKHLRHAIDWWMTVAAREDPWSKQVYDQARAAGHSRYRAYRGLGAAGPGSCGAPGPTTNPSTPIADTTSPQATKTGHLKPRRPRVVEAPPSATVQGGTRPPRLTAGVCVIHLLRNTFKYAARQNWDAIARDIKPVYTAPTAAAAEARFAEFADIWGTRYPAAIGLWRSAWEEFIPFLAYDVEIRRVICTTNAIESLNARFRRAVRARGHFPTDQAALKCLYLVARSLDPTGTAKKRWMNRWKPALNAFAITFPGRLDPAGNNQ